MKTLLTVLILLVASLGWAAEKTLTLSAEDILRWENLALKIQLHESRVQTIQRDVQDAAGKLAAERESFATHFQKVYGVPLERVERAGDLWTVKPEPPKAPTKEKK